MEKKVGPFDSENQLILKNLHNPTVPHGFAVLIVPVKKYYPQT